MARYAFGMTVGLLLVFNLAESSASPGTTNGHFDATREVTPKKTRVCETAACEELAETLKANRAANYTLIDPCTDFTTYVCGGWKASHEIAPNATGVSVVDHLAVDVEQTIKAILQSPYPDNSNYTGENRTYDQQNFEKMQTIYTSCMDTASIDRVGPAPLLDLIAEYESQYALRDNFTSGDLTKLLAWTAKQGFSIFIHPYIGAKDQNENLLTPHLGDALNALPYNSDEDSLASYTLAMIQMFDSLFGADQHTQHEAAAKRVLDLELAELELTKNATDSAHMTVSEIQQLVPQIDIQHLLHAMAPAGYALDTIQVDNPAYLGQITNLIRTASTKSINWRMKWYFMYRWSAQLSEQVIAPITHFQDTVLFPGGRTRFPRSQTCIYEVEQHVQWLQAAAYIQRALPPDTKTTAESIAAHIRQQAIRSIQNLPWMTTAVKSLAISKISKMISLIAYPTSSNSNSPGLPPDITNPASLHAHYAPITVSNTTYFLNTLSLSSFSVTESWRRLLDPNPRAAFTLPPTDPNPGRYFASSNTIFFPAGSLHPPFFRAGGVPSYANYAAFGAVYGHEVVHAFDTMGRQFDAEGQRQSWWDEETVVGYEARTGCLVEQFDGYQVVVTPGGERVGVNGTLTVDENGADTGGLGFAFGAWKMDGEKEDGDKEVPGGLPGLEGYTPEQLFFMVYGNLLCGKKTVEGYRVDAQYNPHSPYDVRILGTVANQRAFREAFSCPVKEPVCELF